MKGSIVVYDWPDGQLCSGCANGGIIEWNDRNDDNMFRFACYESCLDNENGKCPKFEERPWVKT